MLSGNLVEQSSGVSQNVQPLTANIHHDGASSGIVTNRQLFEVCLCKERSSGHGEFGMVARIELTLPAYAF
jgi:hypothetical protein